MVRVKWSSVLIVAAVTTACIPGGEASEAASRLDSAGVEIVQSTGIDRALDWTFTESYRIGGADAGPEAFFRVFPQGVEVGPDGAIHLIDRGNHRISVFDSDGEFLRSIGSEGEGPGEFTYPSSLDVAVDGVITVFDFRHQNFLRFAPDGNVLESTPRPGTLVSSFEVSGDTLTYLSRNTDREVGEWSFSLNRAAGSDTVTLAATEPRALESILLESCGIGLPGMPIFESTLLWTSGPTGTLVQSGYDYSISVFRDGEIARIIRRSLPPMAATNEMAIQEIGEGMTINVGGQDRVCDATEAVEKRGIAPFVPPLTSLVSEDDGTVWAQRKSPGARGGVDIFEPGGAYIGTLPPDAPYPVAFLPDGRLVALETDDLDLQYLVVYSVDRS